MGQGGASSYIGPTMTEIGDVRCFKSNVFNANECDEIIVENAGYAPTNGVYVRESSYCLGVFLNMVTFAK